MLGRGVRAKDTYLRGHGVLPKSLEYAYLSVMGNSVATEDTGVIMVKNRRQRHFQKECVHIVKHYGEILKQRHCCNVGFLMYFYACIILSDSPRRNTKPVVHKHKEQVSVRFCHFKRFLF